MGIIKDPRALLREERQKNEQLQALVAKQKEALSFLGVLAADVDIDELMESGEEEPDHGED